MYCQWRKTDGAAYACSSCGTVVDNPGLRRCGPRSQAQPASPGTTPSSAVPVVGVGRELKRILRGWGIVPTSNCECDQRAEVMDLEGPDWCQANLETIVDWLQEEARNRRLPFLRIIGRRLVGNAIKAARKKLAILSQQED